MAVCTGGPLPGDFQELWRSRDPEAFHLGYGYSGVRYETAGGLGVEGADPEREVYVMVGDGSCPP